MVENNTLLIRKVVLNVGIWSVSFSVFPISTVMHIGNELRDSSEDHKDLVIPRRFHRHRKILISKEDPAISSTSHHAKRTCNIGDFNISLRSCHLGHFYISLRAYTTRRSCHSKRSFLSWIFKHLIKITPCKEILPSCRF